MISRGGFFREALVAVETGVTDLAGDRPVRPSLTAQVAVDGERLGAFSEGVGYVVATAECAHDVAAATAPESGRRK